MGGCSVDDDQVIASSSSGPRTLVLVGCTGNGKSATGNSILLKKAFVSEAKSSGVTRTCELHTTVVEGGQILNVIDTPGLFDFSAKTEFTSNEIAKCINMAKDGIHAVLVVLSVKTRFSEGEEAVINSLRTLFGNKLTDYMIIVFTGGDELEYDEKSLEDYLRHDYPKPLQELLQQCENRRVLFNNRTRDWLEKEQQVQELLYLVNLVVAKNGGKPYTNELFVEQKKGVMKLNDQPEEGSLQQNEEQLIKRLTVMVESKFRENTAILEKQLAEEKSRLEQKLAEEKARHEQRLAEEKAGLEQKLAEEKAELEQKLAEEKAVLELLKLAEEKARLELQLAEEKARAQEKSIDEIHKMRKDLERAERELLEQAGKELLHQCENRVVLFNNRTHDEWKKDEQVQKLLFLVNLVAAKNDGKPYTDELFVEVKKGVAEFYDQKEEVFKLENEEQLIKRITELVESKRSFLGLSSS